MTDALLDEARALVAERWMEGHTLTPILSALIARVEAAEKDAKRKSDGWRKLLHAAFHIMDDSCEDAQTGGISIDNDIAGNYLRQLGEALEELEVDTHEAIDPAIAQQENKS